MNLRLKFNLVLSLVFLSGLGVTGAITYRLLHDSAQAEVVRNAEQLMETALAIRSYTVSQVVPNFQMQLQRAFLPQSVPAYAATETLKAIRSRFPDYSYKEAALNPTNPRDRATDWEADIINEFRGRPDAGADAAMPEITGIRETATGPVLYIARPIKITNPACLACHTSPAEAPETMIKMYGEANGFGWKLNEVIGTQVVSVPMTVPIENARRLFYSFMASLFGVFLLVFLALNLMLTFIVIKPITELAELADQVSLGAADVPQLAVTGNDEISALTSAFNRMRRSLEKAMQMLGS